MTLPTWGDLLEYHCTNRTVKHTHGTITNPCHETLARRRYNYSPIDDSHRIRIVFLRGVLDNPTNKTLRRDGRFIWCKDLAYEGRSDDGWRQVSFSVDDGQKRFIVGENNLLCIPSKTYINNKRFFRPKTSTFVGFSSLFCYGPAVSMMATAANMELEDFISRLSLDNPLRPGTLVSPRLGYLVNLCSPSFV